MLSPKYFIYLAVGNDVSPWINITCNPRIDAGYINSQVNPVYQELWLVQPPMSIWLAEKVLEKLQKFPPQKLLKSLPALVYQAISEIDHFHEMNSIKHIKQSILKVTIPDLLKEEYIKKYISEIPQIDTLIWGRNVLSTELPELIKISGYDLPWDPENWMQALVLQNKVHREASISLDFIGVPFCRRCGSNSGIVIDNCIFCGSKSCFVCTNCQEMGLSKSCIPLYYKSYPDSGEINGQIEPCLEFDLTPPQKRATHALEEFYLSSQKYFLVWAVCGGGKTEVSFGIVAKVLSQGGRVLFAIPRKDIVIELLPRFAKAFPGISINTLYGGSGGRYQDSQLTIATTHQCLRFYQGFDLVILDEADAFPYQGSSMLHYAVERAVKPQGKLVIMTATPDRNLIEKAQSGKIHSISIPARHHRKPLVVPEYIKMNLRQPGSGKTWNIPPSFLQLMINAYNNKRRLLIFLPTIKLIDSIGKELIEWSSQQGLRGAYTHSRQDNRTQVKEQLNEGQLDYVITSTIFERGITIPNLDVIVLFADYETIYDSRTLIQIAGRVGRLGEPAKVIYLAKTESRAMKESCRWIRQMNQEGIALGYVDQV